MTKEPNVSKWLIQDFNLSGYPGRLIMLAISIFLVATGVSLYLGAKLVPMPMEGITHAVSEKILKKLPFHDVKVIMDCTSLGIGIELSFLFLGRLEGIREGTVLCAVLVGKLMKPFRRSCQCWSPISATWPPPLLSDNSEQVQTGQAVSLPGCWEIRKMKKHP